MLRLPSGDTPTLVSKARQAPFIVRRGDDRSSIQLALPRLDAACAIDRRDPALPAQPAVIEAKGWWQGNNGIMNFDALRSALASHDDASSVFLYAFDLMDLEGQDLRQHP
jgi:ATP-dependent DNA ligase